MIEDDSELATTMVLRGVFRDDLAAAYDSLLPTGEGVIDVATIDVADVPPLSLGEGTED